MVLLAKSGASSLEIGRALGIKPSAVRSKLCALGYSLRKPRPVDTVRLVLRSGPGLRAAAARRGIGVPALIRRLIDTIIRDKRMDQVLSDSPLVAADKAAAVYPEESVHSLIIERKSVGAAAFPYDAATAMRDALAPQLTGCVPPQPRFDVLY